ncbi:MAG: GHKL domain-containing protein [Epulopiscium sp.]|nr:GHKL domain-containing protein [Candidatus Epulonipiscium sp.]
MRREISISKLQKILVILHIAQWVAIFLLLVNRILLQFEYIQQNVFNQPGFLLLFILIIIAYNSYINWKDFKEFIWWKEQSHMYKDAYENIKILNRDLRSQRHDFLNHIQILYSLVELEEYEEVGKYLHTLYGDIGKLNKHIKTAHPAINALLQAKSYDAQKRDVDYQVIIQTKLEELTVSPWELCRCLGNLIDNGLEAATEVQGLKQLTVTISEDLINYDFLISNTGVPSDFTSWEDWLEAGYTTKNKKGHGMGLYIVKRILDECQGKIEIHSSEERTIATIRIPKLAKE